MSFKKKVPIDEIILKKPNIMAITTGSGKTKLCSNLMK